MEHPDPGGKSFIFLLIVKIEESNHFITRKMIFNFSLEFI